MARSDCKARKSEVPTAVVFLSDITRGRPLFEDTPGAMSTATAFQLGGVVVREDCRWRPSVQLLAPVGAPIRVASRDDEDISLRIAGRKLGESDQAPSLSGKGARATLTAPAVGPVYLREENQPPAAWLYVAHHPYHALSDAKGNFSLEDVPPGTYELQVWLPPSGALNAGRVEFGQGVRLRRKVKVRANSTTRLSLRL
jgi:hypothetical protein